MKRLFLIIIILLPHFGFARATDSCASQAMKKLFIEPFPLVDFYNSPSLRLGGELPIGYNRSAIATVGVYPMGYYLKAGIKQYGKRGRSKNRYFSVNAFYKNEGYAMVDNILVTDPYLHKPTAEGPKVDYDVHKRVGGINVEVGQAYFRGNLSLEWYAGAGIRIKTATVSISDSLQNRLYNFTESEIENYTDRSAKNAVLPSLSLGIRIGYVFKPVKRF